MIVVCVACDRCKEVNPETAAPNAREAKEKARNAGWRFINARYFHPDCYLEETQEKPNEPPF